MDGSEFRSPPKRIVLGNLNQNAGSPISPMANLKLLTKVATSHYSIGENKQIEDGLSNKNMSKDSKPSRRFRSLSFICKKFLLLYKLDIPAGESQSISLGNLALSLGIEKRRVYDIINVVSSLHMAVKVCKDKYCWYGNQNLPMLLSQLKAYALINKVDQQIHNVLQNHSLYSTPVPESSRYIKINQGYNRSVTDENRIGVLCQKFIMIFLVCNNDVPLNMVTISKLILSGDVNDKTGMRRLYDIANVLEALDLIKRYHCAIMKKPSFQYCGPDIKLNEAECERMVPFTLPCFNQIQESSDHGDTNSDSSLDCINNTSKLDFILEAACADLEEENNSIKPIINSPVSRKKRLHTNSDSGIIECNARKQLFPSSATAAATTPAVVPPPYIDDDEEQTSDTFIKAPKQSFRLTFNELKVLENNARDNNSNNIHHTTIIAGKLPAEKLSFGNFTANFNKFGRLEENNIKFNLALNCCNTKHDKTNIIEQISNDSSTDTNYNNNNNNNNNSNNNREISNNKQLMLTQLRNINSNSQAIIPAKIKVLRPMKLSDIQNGGIYKVVKKGNSVQLYAL
ncbi:hypothetical protein O3M35_013112 [Rhynocoris fuscipes]|uniref:E2F/DP family winged-helix DNA-binding domain-containing protein n=1 Tax=Rhynocoris fuscipes TaxID=488301 RepID=A0AAW1CEV5_9HEMI